MLTLEIISLIFVIFVNTVVFWLIVSQSWRTVSSRYFAAAVFFVIIWAIGMLLLLAEQTFSVGRVIYLISSMYLVLFLAFFAAIFPAKRGKALTLPNKLLLAMTIVYSLAIIVQPSMILQDPTSSVSGQSSGLVANQFGYVVYLLYFSLAFLIAFTALYRRIRTARGFERKQLLYIFAGTLTAAAFSIVTNLILPVLGMTNLLWLGPVWTLFYVVMVGIAIARHRLFDVKLAAVRTTAYVGVLATLSVIYYASAYFVSLLIMNTQTEDTVSLSPINVFLALVLAFLFQPLKQFFDKVSDNIFYKDNYRSEDFYAALNLVLTSTTDLRSLLTRASEEVSRTFKAERASFFVYYENDSKHYMSAGTSHARFPLADAEMLRAITHIQQSEEAIIFTDTLKDEAAQRMLKSHGISLLMPLMQGTRVLGYLLLGEHRGGSYTARDINVLSSVKSELVIAIQNALSLQEVKELNATLQQRIDVATKELRSKNAQLKHIDEVKDEFMSMASHQLRTPLTSIKGYLSMVLDGDMGRVAPQQEKVLRESFNSSERMVHLIADFLNVSRLQTGKFVIEKAIVDFNNLVEHEVEDLEVMAKSHKLELVLKLPKTKFLINADAAKLREVITNFIDNAIFYSRAGSKIAVKVKQDGGSLLFTVTDTGIGVPKKEQAKLFSKFYRATNARRQRPDGTGVGLYLARKVVMAHGGKVIFESIEGKGSIFGFRIPLANLPNKTDDPDYNDHNQ